MSDKNSPPNTMIIVALIGALAAIFGACIAIIPSIIPLVGRPTSTSTIPFTATFQPSDTPAAPDTPSSTTAPSDVPTLTPTFMPPATDTATITFTAIPPTSEVNAYVGTWTNADPDPTASDVKLVLTRLEISKTDDTTASFTACRAVSGGETYVQPNSAQASFNANGLGASDFVISNYPNLRWAIFVKFSGNQLQATVHEYDVNNTNILLGVDTFQLKKPGGIIPRGEFIPCQTSTFTQ